MSLGAKSLPAGLERYKATAVFDRASVPAALLQAHRVKAGVWGLLRVVRGRVTFCLDAEPGGEVTLRDGETVVIEPDVPHHVDLPDAESAFQVEFYRAKAQG